MKVRKFYPLQVLRKLQGEHAVLSKGQEAAFRFAALKGRKLGIAIVRTGVVNKTELLAAQSNEIAERILANCNTKIVMKLAV